MSLILPGLTPDWAPVGQYMIKSGDKPKAVYSLTGRLYLSKSGWVLLSVPNSLVRGAFDALGEPGIELPPQDDGATLQAHISVIRPEEIEKVPGGADKITERGHTFRYQLGRVKTVVPTGWAGISKVWLIEVRSPELQKLRKSYGLTPKPKGNQFEFHITIAVRRKRVLQSNPVSKAAIDRLSAYTRTKAREGRRISPFFWSFAKAARKKKHSAGYLKETEKIKKNRVGKGSKSHKFVHAEWTHPNGHPRCLLCGCEERIGGHCEGYEAFLRSKQAHALGIPDRSQYGDLSKLQPGQLLDLIIQSHAAQRAGHHYDVRIGSPELGLLSWATRKELPKPGSRIAAFRQPLHSHAYGAFQGILPKGYGAGVVRTHARGRLLVTKVEPDKIHFTTAHQKHPERFILLRPRASLGYKMKHWLLINATPREMLPYEKVHYAKIPAEKVEPHLRNLREGDSVQAKIDGAASLVKLLKDGVEVVSYRQSKTTGRPIIHTERVFHGRPQLKIPPELVGTVLKGELYGIKTPETVGETGVGATETGLESPGERQRETRRLPGPHRGFEGPNSKRPTKTEGEFDDERTQLYGVRRAPTEDQRILPREAVQERGSNGRRSIPEVRHGGADKRLSGFAIPPQQLGGLLNAAVGKSLERQRRQGIRLRTMLYDLQQLGETRIDPTEVPYAKRREWLAKVLQFLPAGSFHLPTEAKDPESAQQLWERIRSGQEPTTEEGIVIHPATGKPMKSKFLEEQDVHLTGTYPAGAGKYEGVGAGGFTYALKPGGPTIGRVGTGLSDELRREMFEHPEEFVGRIARVRSQGAFPETQALRAPALLALHEG